MQNGQHSHCSGYTFAAAKVEIHRIQMAQKGAEATECRHAFRHAQAAGNDHGHHAFGHIPHQRQCGSKGVAHPQHVGGAGVVGALGAGVSKAEQPAHQNGGRYGPQQVGKNP